LNMFFSFAEEMKVDGSGEFPEAWEYTQEDAATDEKVRAHIQKKSMSPVGGKKRGTTKKIKGKKKK
jgi:hypothetical protein